MAVLQTPDPTRTDIVEVDTTQLAARASVRPAEGVHSKFSVHSSIGAAAPGALIGFTNTSASVMAQVTSFRVEKGPQTGNSVSAGVADIGLFRSLPVAAPVAPAASDLPKQGEQLAHTYRRRRFPMQNAMPGGIGGFAGTTSNIEAQPLEIFGFWIVVTAPDVLPMGPMVWELVPQKDHAAHGIWVLPGEYLTLNTIANTAGTPGVSNCVFTIEWNEFPYQPGDDVWL